VSEAISGRHRVAAHARFSEWALGEFEKRLLL